MFPELTKEAAEYGEEGGIVLTEDGYLATKARESWVEFYRARETKWERDGRYEKDFKYFACRCLDCMHICRLRKDVYKRQIIS